MDEISGFFAAPSSDVPEGLALVYDSGAWCELWRGTRSGKFRCYKSLKPEFRGRPLYESLLRKEFDAGFSLDHPGIRRYISFMCHPELGNCIELEWVDGKIWANVYTTDMILVIDPSDGEVESVINCAGLLPDKLHGPDTDVLNGIAVSADGRIFLTGKKWPRLYEVKLVPAKK